jgi:ribosomal protein S18 acetylase RimI-like enzyme
MNVDLREAPIETVAELGRIPIAFMVERIYDVSTAGALERFDLSERVIDVPYLKDYDLLEGEGPSEWPNRFDIRRWGFLQVRSPAELVGGAVVAFQTPDMELLEGRSDLAVLWDIRVVPDMRRQGLGAMLFRAAEDWASARRCVELRVETQNINVPACRLYRRQGCVLSRVRAGVYPALPDEIQLLWSKAPGNQAAD